MELVNCGVASTGGGVAAAVGAAIAASDRTVVAVVDEVAMMSASAAMQVFARQSRAKLVLLVLGDEGGAVVDDRPVGAESSAGRPLRGFGVTRFAEAHGCVASEVSSVVELEVVFSRVFVRAANVPRLVHVRVDVPPNPPSAADPR
jgi:thiamine pyrophosphate-dependent acetolactate synthase large subunit-like protein